MSKTKEKLVVVVEKHNPMWVGVFLGIFNLFIISAGLYLAIIENNTGAGIAVTVLLLVDLYMLSKVYFVYNDEILEVKKVKT